MNRITSQTSLQAAKVIQDASQFEDVQITVSWSGDVREANTLERVIYGVVDFFDAGAPERRKNEAREAVKAKLTAEVLILAGPTPRDGAAALPDEMTKAINQVANNLISTGAITKKNLPSDLADALQNIKKITAETDKKSRKLIWKAVAEQRNKNKQVSIDAANNISQNTKIWKESLNISTRDAFRLASNAWELYESKKILPEEGKEILRCYGRLISRHGFKEKDALNYAIDLRAPLKTLSLGMDSVERAMKSLDYAIPELREQPERLRISAAVRYLQLQDAKYKDVQPIDEIRRSLDDLPRLQQAMPKGCVIDQIHQGSHIRGLSKHSFPEPSPNIGDKKKSLTAPEQALTDGANALMSAKPLGSTSKPVHGVSLPKVFSQFYSHHVEDLVRGNRFELRTGEKVDTKFSQIEEKRRENPKKLSTQAYEEWATERARWAGSDRAIQIISGLESQTLFADVAVFSGEQFQNKDQYSVSAVGENNLAQTSFQANRLTDTNFFIDEFILRETHYDNATRLLAEPTDMNDHSDELLLRPQLKIPLIPNPGESIKAGAGGFSVKRSVGLSLTVPKISQMPPTCRITEVSEEWDLMVDWDEWMSMRREIGTL
jgi:hypothetical protein